MRFWLFGLQTAVAGNIMEYLGMRNVTQSCRIILRGSSRVHWDGIENKALIAGPRHEGAPACRQAAQHVKHRRPENLQRSQIANQRNAPKILLDLLPRKHFGQSRGKDFKS